MIAPLLSLPTIVSIFRSPDRLPSASFGRLWYSHAPECSLLPLCGQGGSERRVPRFRQPGCVDIWVRGRCTCRGISCRQKSVRVTGSLPWLDPKPPRRQPDSLSGWLWFSSCVLWPLHEPYPTDSYLSLLSCALSRGWVLTDCTHYGGDFFFRNLSLQ